MSDALTPTEGARFLFERERDDAAGAHYKVAIYTPAQTLTGTARLGFDGAVAVDVPGAPPELTATAEIFAKLVARSAEAQRAAGMPPWPARVLRWRGPGRGK